LIRHGRRRKRRPPDSGRADDGAVFVILDGATLRPPAPSPMSARHAPRGGFDGTDLQPTAVGANWLGDINADGLKSCSSRRGL